MPTFASRLHTQTAQAAGTRGVPARRTPQLTPLKPPFDSQAYLTPTSDAVSLLVLGRQAQMHNLITLTNYQGGRARLNPLEAGRSAGSARSARPAPGAAAATNTPHLGCDRR